MTLRQHALSAFDAGIRAADPAHAVSAAIQGENGSLKVRLPDGQWRQGNWERVWVVSFGKAAVSMALSAAEAIPASLLATPPLVVTSYENVREVPGLDIVGASHPLPDGNGEKAARRVLDLVSAAQSGDLVVVLISGGASALLPLPVDGVSLEEKIHTTEILLGSGANINEMNAVRKHLSRIKGGQLAKAAAPADLHGLILSDVIGDDLGVVASGPTVADSSSFDDAMGVIKRYGVLSKFPESVRNHLLAGCEGRANETPKPGNPCFNTTVNTLIGGNGLSLDAVAQVLTQGFEVQIVSRNLCGEAAMAADFIVENVKKHWHGNPLALVAGGETTVTLRGSGKGGRNQELALAFAGQAGNLPEDMEWAFLSGGTDGIDGPTDAAGGVVDAGTFSRIESSGLSGTELLANNDAYHALQASGDLIKIGATGTNVADLQIFLAIPKAD